MSLQKKVALAILGLATVGITAIICAMLVLSNLIRTKVEGEAQFITNHILDVLAATDESYRELVDASTRVLKGEIERRGPPRLGPEVLIGKELTHTVIAGSTELHADHSVVDRVKQLIGGTSTIFAKRGDDFIRVSTNVLKPDGTRAAGTKLDPAGAAYRSVKRGEAFFGVVEILGQPYYTAYTPMVDAKNDMIGVWYAGFPLSSMTHLAAEIEKTRLLKTGYLAVIDASGKVRFKSANADPKLLENPEIKGWLQSAAGSERLASDGWIYERRIFTRWNYVTITAINEQDVRAEIFSAAIKVMGPTLLLALLGAAGCIWLAWYLTRHLKESAGRLGEVASSVEGSSLRVSESTQQVSTATLQQSTAMKQAVASVEEISAMIRANSENAGQSRTLSGETLDLAKQGRRAVEEMITSMQEINRSNSEIAKQVEEGNREISEISKLIINIREKTTIINDIVFQTKLLSFNASVEAARAGAHGSGFAVVAEEIGNLARMSGTAASEISVMLESSVTNVHQIIEQNRKRIEPVVLKAQHRTEEGIQNAEGCGTTLNDIVGKVSQVNDMVSKIADASAKQAAGAQEITTTMRELEQAIDRNTTSAQEGASTAHDLTEQAEALNSVLDGIVCIVEGSTRAA